MFRDKLMLLLSFTLLPRGGMGQVDKLDKFGYVDML